MVIGSELEGNGVQIFDMKKLLTVTDAEAPVLFTNAKDMTGHFNATLPLGSTHNIVINEEAKYGVAVGVRPRGEYCNGGLHFFSLEDPSNPVELGCDVSRLFGG